MFGFRLFIPSAFAALLIFPLILFSQQTEDLGTVVVTAAKHETSLRSVSTTSTVITAAEIERRGLQTVAEALRHIVSFDITQAGGPGGLSYPQLRGLTAKYMVVLINGVRVNDPADANGGVGTLFSHLSTSDISRIEVIRGPQSPLYGSNANSGVINIITRSGSSSPAASLSYEGGSLNSHRIGFDYSAGKAGFNFRAGEDITATAGLIDLETYRNYTTSVQLGYSKPGALDWETIVRHTRMNNNFAELSENSFGALWTVELPDPHQENRFDYTIIGNKVEHHITGNWLPSLNFGISRRDRKTADPNDGPLGSRIAVEDEFDWDGSLLYHKGDVVPVLDAPYGPADYRYLGTNYDLDYRHTLLAQTGGLSEILTAGIEYLYQGYTQSGSNGNLSGDLGTTSVYAHNQALLLDEALSLNAGARYDSHERAGGKTTGMLGLAYDIQRNGLILRGNVGSAFRAPAYYELFETQFGNGNPALKPENSLTWEFGIEKYSADKNFRLTLSTWHTKVEDAIVWAWTGPEAWNGKYLNVDRLRSDGLEAGVDFKPFANWLFGFNYTYTDSRKYSSSTGAWSRNIQLPFNKLNLNATYLYRGASFSLDGYALDNSSLRWNGIDKAKGYFKLDLTSRVPLHGHLTASLRLQNLLDADYVESIGFREAGFTAFGGLELRY